MNSFGRHFILTSYGRTHSRAIGGVVHGCPVGLALDLAAIQAQLERRRPGRSRLVSPRNEPDIVRFTAGLDSDNKTTGTPIEFQIDNTDVRTAPYEHLRRLYRPGHADFTYQQKYRLPDCGTDKRASARETAIRVVGGAIARQWLEARSITIQAYASQIGTVIEPLPYTALDLTQCRHNQLETPNATTANAMAATIEAARTAKDSVGGIVTCVVKGVPVGVGEPLFDKLQARLAAAMLSIPAAKGFDYGSGFAVAAMYGSESNDVFIAHEGQFATEHNLAGGILGGISTGEDIYFRVAFKPMPSIGREQRTIDIDLNPTTIAIEGRHDPCVVPRAIPVVEAMAALTLIDLML